MPFKPVQQEKCPRCEKSVYAAESRAVGDLKFHKECYKCSMCQKMLDSTNSNCHEAVLYCKTCHGRKFGPKGYGFGGGGGGLSMDTGAHLGLDRDDTIKVYKAPKAAAGEGCPRCGGRVYAAECMNAKGKEYHKTCFNCKTCRKALDSVNHCDGPDKDVYCKVCYGKGFGPQGFGFGCGGGTLTSAPDANPTHRPHGNADLIIPAKEGEEACPRCKGKVYSAEAMLAKGRPFHKRCFKCLNCKRALDSMTHCDGADNEIYCRLCYAKKYGPKGYGFAAGAGGVLTAENIAGGEDVSGKVDPALAALDTSKIQAAEGFGCPKCGGKVFMAEEMFARGRSYHKRCYNCEVCHKPLDSLVGCDAPDGKIYCKLCYAKRYGPKGYGFAAGGGGVLTAENISGDVAGKVSSGMILDDLSKIKAKEGQGCPRCGGAVYMAEEVHARGRRFHKRCYSCCHCKRPLDSVVGCDSPDGEVYCKLCYAKKYGPKGYGFAAGGGGVLSAENIPGGNAPPGINPASVAINTTSILAAPGEGCPRCGGKVFSAEERLSRGKSWHSKCYSCCDCTRPLDSMVQCDGPDGDIYCKLCYAKKFGPKGYGFAAGSGGVLFPESIDVDDLNQTSSNRDPIRIQAVDVTKIPAKEGQSRCPRCSGAVFQAEAMAAKGKEWHKGCFSCVDCRRPLDSMVACDAPDGEIYCQLCYAKRHGPKGYGYGHTPCLMSRGTEDGTPVPVDIRQFGFDPKGTGQGPIRPWAPPAGGRPNPGQHPEGAPQRNVDGPNPLPVGEAMMPRGVEPAEEEVEIEEIEVEEEVLTPTTPPPSDSEEIQMTDSASSPCPQISDDFPPPPSDLPDSNEPDAATADPSEQNPESNIEPEMYAQMTALQQQMQKQFIQQETEQSAESVQKQEITQEMQMQQELQQQQMQQQKEIQQQMQVQLEQQMQQAQSTQMQSQMSSSQQVSSSVKMVSSSSSVSSSQVQQQQSEQITMEQQQAMEMGGQQLEVDSTPISEDVEYEYEEVEVEEGDDM